MDDKTKSVCMELIESALQPIAQKHGISFVCIAARVEEGVAYPFLTSNLSRDGQMLLLDFVYRNLHKATREQGINFGRIN